MNPHLKKLYELSTAPSRLIIGLMSGTSLDGLDIALCRFEGSGIATKTTLLNFKTIAYDAAFKEELKAISFKEQVDLQKLCLLNAYIGTYHAALVLQCLAEWGVDPATVDVVASHGQTVFHAPQTKHQQAQWPNATLQIGDGDHLAVKSGLLTISDFRQKHITAGGEGARLAVYGDYLIFSSREEHRILLNIGGIANFTYLPSGSQTAEVFSTDVGPGNTMMDQYVQQFYPGMTYDQDGLLAAAGEINQTLLKALLDEPFLDLPFPKTTGPELFNLNYLNQALAGINEKPGHEDILATLCEFTAITITNAITRAFDSPGLEQALDFEIYVSGGGMHNQLLLQKLEQRLQKNIRNTSALGIDPDAKEAVLFALLANECLTGGRLDFGSRPGLPSVMMGKISLPA